jgi:hypothetical protein
MRPQEETQTMASNPANVTCSKDTWVKVATATQSCTIHKRNSGFDSTTKLKTAWYHTYVVTADPAPTGATYAIPWTENTLRFAADTACDVYIFAANAAGSVRVDA